MCAKIIQLVSGATITAPETVDQLAAAAISAAHANEIPIIFIGK